MGQLAILDVESAATRLMTFLLRHVRDGCIVRGREMVYLLELLNSCSKGQSLVAEVKGKENRRPPGARQPPSEAAIGRASSVRTPWG